MEVYNYLKHSKRVLLKKGMPLHLILFVTTKCNCKCKHCFFWKELNKGQDLTLEEYKKISESMDDLLLLDITGGEPFLRKDLPEIVKLFYDNNHARHIVIPTNGLLKNEIIPSTKAILQSCPDANIVIYVSFDDIDEGHDNIRGVKGTFQKAIESFNGLKELKKEYKNLNVGTLTTAMSINQTRLKEIYSYLKNNLKPDMAYLNLIRGNPKETIAADIDLNYYSEMIRIIEKDLFSKDLKGHGGFQLSNISNATNILTHRAVEETNLKKKYLMPCYAGGLSAVIYSDGKLFPCELLNKQIADLRLNGYNFREAWYSKEAEEIRGHIKNSKCFCTHECFTNINIMFNPRFLPNLMYKGIKLL